MNKNQKIIAAVVLIAAIAVSGIFWFPILQSKLEPPHTTPPAPATNVEQLSPQYLPGYVYQTISNTGAGTVFESATRIFLVSATTYYGYANQTIKSPNPAGGNEISKGDPIFIVNATLRNDYSPENPLPLSQDSYAYIFLTATLYTQNSTIKANDVSPTNPFVGPFLTAYIGLNSGETGSVEIWMSTANRNINHYELNLDVFGTPPA